MFLFFMDLFNAAHVSMSEHEPQTTAHPNLTCLENQSAPIIRLSSRVWAFVYVVQVPC